MPPSAASNAYTPTDFTARLAGALLIAASILEIAVMAHHPAVHTSDVSQAIAQIRAMSSLSGWVHGLLITLMLTGFFALTEFALRRDLARPAIRAGLVAYAVGVVAMTGAALVSGFITPQVAMASPGMSAADLQLTAQLLKLCSFFNRTFARLGAIAMLVGITAWSLDLMRGARAERALGAAGIVIGLACALIAGVLQLDVHGMTLVLVLQAIWLTGVGVLLLRGRAGGSSHQPMP